MKYMGSKARIAKELLPIILRKRKPEQWYVEPFVGGANMIDKVTGNRIGADVNDCLIVALKFLAGGWVPPIEISRDMYSEQRDKFKTGEYYSDEEMALIGYVGINGSYGGRWFDGGYAGISETESGSFRNYPLEAWNNVMKQAPNLSGIVFRNSCYKDLVIPRNSIIYCDPAYKGTKEYQAAVRSGFNSDEFWQWCRDKASEGHSVFVSEYQAPEDFTEVWRKGVKSSLSQANKNSIEKLFVHKSQVMELIFES